MKELKAPLEALFDKENDTNLSVPLTVEPVIDSSRRKVRTEAIVTRLTDRMVVRSDFARIMEDEVIYLANLCADLFLQDPVCLDLDLSRPLIVVGDLFGQHANLVTIFSKCGHPSTVRYLFLGNLVNRGERSIELVTLLFAYKVLYPNNIYLIRGNHECQYISTYYGFLHECRQRHFNHIWTVVMHAFNCLPAVAIIEDSIFCTHSGLPQGILCQKISTRKQLRDFLHISITRPVPLTQNMLLTELAWSELVIDGTHCSTNPAGLGKVFSENYVKNFCAHFGFQQVIRSNEFLKNGYEFSADGKMLTLFSTPNMLPRYRNSGAVAFLYKRIRDHTIVGRINVLDIVPLLRKGRPGLTTLQVTDYYQGRINETVDSLEEPEDTGQSRTDNRHFLYFYAHDNLSFDSTVLSLDHVEEGWFDTI
ncbi:hypothetical protein EG68_02699 [Paragonimus skrjabini miyazakii]|uniref:Serine/threonine-protein phosphatase n=1 Tax=Paragonimus skrjabini miyazakii TaxID=59628 RepID=A0A8S9Z4Z1_9TREM|nr:hypothetical protein EG68_02699 [Paragonimus skrjabini miyazakii]